MDSVNWAIALTFFAAGSFPAFIISLMGIRDHGPDAVYLTGACGWPLVVVITGMLWLT